MVLCHACGDLVDDLKDANDLQKILRFIIENDLSVEDLEGCINGRFSNITAGWDNLGKDNRDKVGQLVETYKAAKRIAATGQGSQ